jgi:hypothetical protein
MGFGFASVDLGSVRAPAEDIQQGGQARAFVHVKSMLNGTRLLTAHLPADRLVSRPRSQTWSSRASQISSDESTA